MKIVKPIIFRNFDSTRASEATYYDADKYLAIAPDDILRLGYDPTTGNFIGPIYEDAGLNYAYSDLSDGAVWDEGSQTVITGPGELNAAGDIVTVLGLRGNGFSVYPASSLNTIPPGDYVLSMYIKPATYGIIQIGFDGLSVDTAVFDAAGSIISNPPNGSAHVQEVGAGWIRISMAGTTATGEISMRVESGSAPSADYGEVYIDFIQLEPITADLLPTSYMVDTGSPPSGAVSFRAADIIVEGPPRVVTSNVDEDDAPVWDDGDTYNAGDPAIVLGQIHKIYRSIGTNTNKYPPDHPEEWTDEGATNRWRMFDMNVGLDRQTVSTDSSNTIDVLVEIDEPVNSLTLLNIEASTVQVTMRDNEGNIVYSHFQNLLQTTPASDWWSFFFAPRTRTKTVVLTDLPNVQPATIEVFIDGDDQPAKVAKLILGYAVDIGCARYGSSVGIVDFSRKERDPFGNNFIIERRYIDRADFDVQILNSMLDTVKDLLASVRATPTLYIGDENFNSTVIYGFYRDFSVVISGPKRSDLTMQVESI